MGKNNVNFGTKSYETRALPGFDLINTGVKGIKEYINNGEGASLGKVGAYLGYRLLSYSGLPIALNLISTILSLALAILTLPLRCCEGGKKANSWLWSRCGNSLNLTLNSLYDLTTDVRMLFGGCCCTQTCYGRV